MDYTESYVSFLLFLFFWGSNHHHEPCHRHDGIYFYHDVSTKISPPRMTGLLPASGHWRFHGTMTPSRSEQAAPLAAGHPAPTSGTDAGSYPIMQGGLFLVLTLYVPFWDFYDRYSLLVSLLLQRQPLLLLLFLL